MGNAAQAIDRTVKEATTFNLSNAADDWEKKRKEVLGDMGIGPGESETEDASDAGGVMGGQIGPLSLSGIKKKQRIGQGRNASYLTRQRPGMRNIG